MPVLFAVTLFVSATLLFMVQPMVGKMILPLLGGSPAAWNTCMVFFQGSLLLGYLYSHTLTTKLEYHPGRQMRIHVALLGITVMWLAAASALAPKNAAIPVLGSLAPQGQAYPMFGVLVLLTVAVGLPFLVVSTSAPLLQRWFVYTGHPAAKDPYFLYAASNAGSLISLLGYPLFIEPSLSVPQQTQIWAVGFTLLTVLVYLCGRAASDPLRPAPKKATESPTPTDAGPGGRVPWSSRLRWLGLAFVPSSLMLGVTFHMTTDIASVPLLWVIPLALYLLTFIVAYGSWYSAAYANPAKWVRPALVNVATVLILLLVFVMASGVGGISTFLLLLMHLTTYFFTALLMHSELARLRPDPRHLTEYFLWISVGGVVGGIFNALVAPVAFPLAWEYPIALAVACLLVPSLYDIAGVTPETPRTPLRRWLPVMFDALIPLGMLALTGWLTVLPEKYDWFAQATTWTADGVTRLIQGVGLGLRVNASTLSILLVYAVPCMLCFLFIDRPIRFGLCVAAVLTTANYRSFQDSGAEASDRSFFGILRVSGYHGIRTIALTGAGKDEEGNDLVRPVRQHEPFRKLMHGTTLHGEQATTTWTYPMQDDFPILGSLTPWDVLATAGAQAAWDFRQEPLTYYHRSGPVGAIFHRFRAVHPTGDVAMVGLGTGSAAAYARPGQKLTFYEIDPTVIGLVEDGRYFSYIADARKRGATVEFVLGDARLKLEEHADRKYGLLLVDAFSSDSIPVHLLTREAMELYKDRITDDGLIAVHISNRYINLEPVVARLAKETGLVARLWSDNDAGPPEGTGPSGKTRSSWVALAKTPEALGEALNADGFKERVGAIGGGMPYMLADRTFIYDHPWQPIRLLDDVPAWTDDYSDVLRVMRLRELQRIRKFFGLPTPVGADD